jgi:hypothetical protein
LPAANPTAASAGSDSLLTLSNAELEEILLSQMKTHIKHQVS